MGEFGGVLGVLIVELAAAAVFDLLEEKRAKRPRLIGVVVEASSFFSSSFSTTGSKGNKSWITNQATD